jgi:deoxycytidylate deaminase
MRTTCAKRAVGCVLTDSNSHVLSIAYNGTAKGVPHCNEGFECNQDSGECLGLHAEANAVAQCRAPHAIHTAYVTLGPCKSCIKLLAATTCQVVVVRTENEDQWPKQFWLSLGRKYVVAAVN